MLRFFLLLFVALVLAVFVGVQLENDPGLVRFYYGGDVMEMRFATFLLLLIGVYAIAWSILTLLGWLLELPTRIANRYRARRSRKARADLLKGLIEIAEGEWIKGERRLVRRAGNSDMPLINYLAAARAAQLQDADGRRDRYLKLAYESTPEATAAVLLTQAELQLEHGQFEIALATLKRVQDINPGNAYSIKLLARTNEALGDWRGVEQLLPRLRKSDVMRERDMTSLETRAILVSIDKAQAAGETALQNNWKNIPRRLRKELPILLAQARALMNVNAHDDAESILRDSIRNDWHDEAVRLYGEIRSKHPEKLLGRVENWLKDHADNPALLAAAGSLCARARLWGKARGYLERSAMLDPRSDTFQKLGDLLKELGQPEAAMRAYQQGLALVRN